MDQLLRHPRSQSRPGTSEVQEASQAASLAALGQAATYRLCETQPGDNDAITRIDTHCSAVFLAGERAYKLKRAIATDYLDYSTLELRHRACVREVSLNRRTAPNLYLGIAALTDDPEHGLTIDGDGEVVEWLTVMQRFDPSMGFDHLAGTGDLTEAHIVSATDQALALHASARRIGDGDEHGGGARGFADNLLITVAELQRTRDCLSAQQLGRLAVGLSAHLTHQAERLDDRLDRGLVVQAHGDLHLGNIALIDNAPTLFDCIEFNDRIACVDQGFDLAFLWMDLDRLGLRDLAWVSFNRYLEVTRDYDIAPLLPLFLATRAIVRTKTSAAAARLEGTLGRFTHARERAIAYADAAERYIQRQRPALIALGGLSGCGKSTAARAIAPTIGVCPGAVVLRSDMVRKQMFDVPPDLPLPQSAYNAQVTRKVYERLGLIAEGLIEAGHSVIVDAVFARPVERAAMENLAKHCNADFTGLWLHAPLDLRIERVYGRAADVSDADERVVREQELYELGAMQWTQVDASGSPCDTVDGITGALAESAENRAEQGPSAQGCDGMSQRPCHSLDSDQS